MTDFCKQNGFVETNEPMNKIMFLKKTKYKVTIDVLVFKGCFKLLTYKMMTVNHMMKGYSPALCYD